jgi:hypothetical protein
MEEVVIDKVNLQKQADIYRLEELSKKEKEKTCK